MNLNGIFAIISFTVLAVWAIVFEILYLKSLSKVRRLVELNERLKKENEELSNAPMRELFEKERAISIARLGRIRELEKDYAPVYMRGKMDAYGDVKDYCELIYEKVHKNPALKIVSEYIDKRINLPFEEEKVI